MGDNRAERDGQRDNSNYIRGIAWAWTNLDGVVDSLAEAGGIAIRGIKFKRKGIGWLVIVQAECNGEFFVAFSDSSSSADLGRVVRSVIEKSDWKPDKFAGLDKVK